MKSIEREELNFILQKSDFDSLETLCKKIERERDIKQLQAPTQQTLLLPVKDPISGGEFYAGEVLVTTTIISLGSEKGWAMVQDDNPKRSYYIAICDACFGANLYKDEIEALAVGTKEEIESSEKEVNQRVNATRVSFDLM